MLQVRILETEDDGEQSLVGTFILNGREITIDAPTPEGHASLSEILKRKAIGFDGPKFPDVDPEGWMRALEVQYDGSRSRAELIEE